MLPALALAAALVASAAAVSARPFDSSALAAAAAAVTRAPYTEQFWESSLSRFLADPNHPSQSASAQEAAAAAAAFTCPAKTFTCTPYADDGVKPSNVRTVRPKDISVVMAIGDSITAGFGMNSGTLPFTSITEYRGLAFDIGGDSGAVTIPNFLKTYNSGVKGASTGTTSLGATVDVLNVAVSGALIGDMPGQVATLKSAFTSGGYSASGWKMLGVLIGANNLCKACNSGTDATNSPAAFEAYFRTTVQALRGNFTNLIVNAYQIFDVSQVYSPQQSSSYCSFAQGLLNECPCSKTDANRALMKSYAQQYNAAMTKVAAEFAGLNDFAVNVQTGVADLIIPAGSDGLNWLAKIDCFHPNQCANQVVAAAAWNNMFQKQGSKTSYQLGAVTPYCPGPTDYFQ